MLKEKLLEWLFAAGGMAAILKFLPQFITSFRTKRDEKKQRENYEDIENIYKVLKQIDDLPNVQRVLILKFSNGGKTPAADAEVYITVLYEDNDASVSEVKHKYQKVLADENYIKMLRNLLEEKELSLYTKDMLPGLLRNAWSVDDVRFGKVFHIHTNRKRTIYMSVSTTRENVAFDQPIEAESIGLGVSKLKQIFSS